MQPTIKKRKRIKHTRFPNGFGSISYMSGKRRKPYWAKKTTGFNAKGHPIYLTIGYYETFEDALIALSEYNHMPYNVKERKATFREIADKWFEGYTEQDRTEGTVKNYRSIRNKTGALDDRKIADISFDELQEFVSKQSAGSQEFMICYLKQVFRYAVKREIILKDTTMYLKKTKTSVPKRNPFTVDEVRAIWNMPQDDIRDMTLIMLYTGMRIGEFATISEVHDTYIIAGEKTDAGKNRIIPLHTLIRPLMKPQFERWTSTHSRHFANMFDGHTPHDCRRTFISRCVECGIDGTVSRKITGHAGVDIHESAYTFLTDPEFLCSEVEKIHY